MSSPTSLSRRQFLRRSTKFAVPLIVAPSVLGRAGAVAPNSRIQLACIGTGGQGTSNLRAFLADERVQVVGIADVDDQHRAAAAKLAGLNLDQTTRDFREIIARSDVDVIMNATPDHWHSNVVIAAARAGKDLYSEKPLAASIAEGRAMCVAVEKNKRILQCGTWRRSGMKVRMACEFVRNGYIGTLKEIEVGVPGTFAIRGGYTGMEETQPVPEHFDYARWLGPAAERPYTAARCHFNFRWVEEYAPGYITDWGAHFLDVAQWGAGMDETSPTEIAATEVRRRTSGIYDAAEGFRIEYHYANGLKVVMLSTDDKTKWGTRFIGNEGWIFTENETLQASSTDILRTKLKDTDVHLYESKNHHRNFIDCVISRATPAAPAPVAQRAATMCHLGSISAVVKRPLKFDPAAETFGADVEANAMLIRPMRDEWKLTA